jgi:hypothetical protein
MPAYTNMAWPEDPYGTGQLWRQEPLLLAGFAVCWARDAEQAVPASYAVVYLRLHRTRPVDLTDGVSFGFRAVVVATEDDARELVCLLDLDALRARRLAKVVAGCSLGRDLRDIGALASGDAGRGIRGLGTAWDDPDGGGPGLARVFDIASEDVRPGSGLAAAAASAGIDPSTVTTAFESQCMIDQAAGLARRPPARGSSVPQEQDMVRSAQWLAACSTERALICAIAAGRILGRHVWEGSLDIGAAMAENTWDCYPSLDFDQLPGSSCHDPVSRVTGGTR